MVIFNHRWYLLIGIIVLFHYVLPITLVYNMKIRRSSSHEATPFDTTTYALTAVPIVYSRNRHIIDPALNFNATDKRLLDGALISGMVHFKKNWWAEIYTGIERERFRMKGTFDIDASRLGFDDFVFSIGRRIRKPSGIELHVYGIGSVPSKRDLTPIDQFDPLVGTRLFSAGFGAEASFPIINTPEKGLFLLTQGRFLHFFKRDWSSAIPNSVFTPGNLNDVLTSIRTRIGRATFETGYNGTFFTNAILQVGQEERETPMFLRNSLFASAGYMIPKMPLTHCPGSIGVGLLISRTKRFDTTIYAGWVYWGISF